MMAGSIINHYREISFMSQPLESPGRPSALFQRTGYNVQPVTKNKAAGDCGERVINVRWTNEWRMKVAFPSWGRKTKSYAFERKLRIARGNIAFRFHRITNNAQTLSFERIRQLNSVRIV